MQQTAKEITRSGPRLASQTRTPTWAPKPEVRRDVSRLLVSKREMDPSGTTENGQTVRRHPSLLVAAHFVRGDARQAIALSSVERQY